MKAPKRMVDLEFKLASLEEELDQVKAERDQYKKLALDIVNSVKNEGRNPEYHRGVLKRHRREWPYLWKRIDRAIAYFDRIPSGPKKTINLDNEINVGNEINGINEINGVGEGGNSVNKGVYYDYRSLMEPDSLMEEK